MLGKNKESSTSLTSFASTVVGREVCFGGTQTITFEKYCPKERRAYWYSALELKALKERDLHRTRKRWSSSLAKNDLRGGSSEEDDADWIIRGFEKKLGEKDNLSAIYVKYVLKEANKCKKKQNAPEKLQNYCAKQSNFDRENALRFGQEDYKAACKVYEIPHVSSTTAKETRQGKTKFRGLKRMFTARAKVPRVTHRIG